MLSVWANGCLRFRIRSVLRLDIAAFSEEGLVCLLRARYYFVSAVLNGAVGGMHVVKNLLCVYGNPKESLADGNCFYCVGRSCRKEFYIRKRKIN